jgi:hypothetical protein
MSLILLTACGKESSPERRSQIRDEKLQKEINILKTKYNAISDSLNVIHNQLRHLHINIKLQQTD